MATFEILLIDDTPAEQRLAVEALKGWTGVQLHLSSDSQTALDFIYRKGNHKHAPRPNLILLDLNLGVVKGHEILEKLKKDPNFKRIPIVVFSNSTNSNDIAKCYDLHANSYLIKPSHLEDYFKLIKAIVAYWTNVSPG